MNEIDINHNFKVIKEEFRLISEKMAELERRIASINNAVQTIILKQRELEDKLNYIIRNGEISGTF